MKIWNVLRGRWSALALLAGSFVLNQAVTGGAAAEASGFVTIDPDQPTQFQLAGEPFHFQGTNIYRLAQGDLFRLDDPEAERKIDDIFTKLQDQGISVVRLWGFSCDHNRSDGLVWGQQATMVAPPVSRVTAANKDQFYREKTLQRLDLVIAKAKEHGIKLIIPFINFEHEYCGVEWFVEEIRNIATPKRCFDNYSYTECKKYVNSYKWLFYLDQEIKAAFKNHIEYVLNRRNTETGDLYRNETSIMAFEVMNEPHTSDQLENYAFSGRRYDKMYDYGEYTQEFARRSINEYFAKNNLAKVPGTIVYEWLKEISAYIKSIDTNHLVTSGEEGYLHDPDYAKVYGNKHTWIHNGYKGVDFDRNVTIPTIDFMTTHLYPSNWNIPTKDFPWFIENVLQTRAELAHQADKPIILEETGFNISGKIQAYAGENRPRYISLMLHYAAEAQYAGTMVWGVVPMNDRTGKPYDRDNFIFGYCDPEMAAIEAQVRYVSGEYTEPYPLCSFQANQSEWAEWGGDETPEYTGSCLFKKVVHNQLRDQWSCPNR
jgi:mannan endo-1,4-beta-mannosidase